MSRQNSRNIIEYADAVIVGAGASGLAAAIELRMNDPSLSVVIIEKNDVPARKIRATGNGRCNITNRNAEGYTEIMKFFTSIGLVTRTYENGLVYPYSESAADVAELLISRAHELGVRIITDAEVTSAGASGDSRFATSFELKTSAGRKSHTIASAYLILACGGKAGPTFGTTGDGYSIARSLGHSIVTPVPVLTPVECREWGSRDDNDAVCLAGTRTRGTVTLIKNTDEDAASSGDGAELFRETGEIQFTKYGLSGICIFNMTRHMRYDRSRGESLEDFTVSADLFPDGDIAEYLRERKKHAFPGEKTADVLRTVLKENIARYVLKRACGEACDEHLAERDVRDLGDADILAISHQVPGLTFHPQRLKGWKEAQVTSGGVSLDELDPVTGGSLITGGLFITGELADRDYMCGGFNLSNAWLTGIGAAHAILTPGSQN